MHIFHLLEGVFLLTLISSVAGARILALLPFAFKSHQIFFQAVLKTLAAKGHEVVVYSPFPQEKPVPNYVDVYVTTSYSDKYITYERVLESFANSPLTVTSLLWKTLNHFTKEALCHENIQKLAKSNEKFDLVITETFMANEAFLAFGHKFNAPTISCYSMGTFGVINHIMGNSLALSYIPNYVFPFSDKLSFFEKLASTFSTIHSLISYYHQHIPSQQAILDECLKLDSSPPLKDMVQNISMVFLNSHPMMTYPQPLTPNIIQLGGIHISDERKPLPQNIKKFMDEAKHGVIYFSLGTFVPDHHFPTQYFQNFINVFKKLNQRVLWRTRAKNIENLPENVMTVQWAPQLDVLGHPNCVLFLTHGGLLSVMEAAYAGVPVVGIPFYSDQPLNLRFLQEKGVGIVLDFQTLSEITISTALNTVLSDPRFKGNAVKLSKDVQDIPKTQADLAVFWVEYVLRHRGAPQLRPASAHMAWYQLFLLDVVATISAAAVVALFTINLTCRKVLSWVTTKKVKVCSKKKCN